MRGKGTWEKWKRGKGDIERSKEREREKGDPSLRMKRMD